MTSGTPSARAQTCAGLTLVNPIGLPEARGLRYDLKMPVPSANEPHQTGFRDHFHMNELNKDGTPNDNWKPNGCAKSAA